jgi:sulfur relay (sulfurtransferase) DsrF/TusC family protein
VSEEENMPKKILSVLSHTEYGNLEDSDIGLFASAFAPVAGQSMTLLLREDAVNYAVRGQDGTGIKIAGTTVQPGFLIETDLQSLRQSNIPVYTVGEDLEERGIKKEELVNGVQVISRTGFGKLIEQFDTVWNW